jgi:hypothetical protein
MASVSGLKRRLLANVPKVQPAFVVYLEPVVNPVKDIDHEVEFHEVTSPDDPLLAQICAPWQLDVARTALAAGDWDIIVAIKDGKPIGRIWETRATERRFFSGIPRVRLAEDEIFMFDLYVDREHRRGNVAMTMAHYFFEKYTASTTVKYIYGFISYDNGPSVLWHDAIGFNIVQTMNYLSIGDRIKWRMPFGDSPRFGPMSRKGRHTDPSVALFGNALLPQSPK